MLINNMPENQYIRKIIAMSTNFKKLFIIEKVYVFFHAKSSKSVHI